MFGRHAFMLGLGVIAAAAATAAAWAQGGAGNYPDHPIRVIVSVPAGGGVDTVTRLVAAKMQVILGQPMVVENLGMTADRDKVGTGELRMTVSALYPAEPSPGSGATTGDVK